MERRGICDNCLNPPQIDAVAVTDPTAVSSEASAATCAPEAAKAPAPRKWERGDPVRVPRYGAGEVALATGEQVAVQFPDGLTRTFMSSYVRAVRRSAR
jgi:ATP-dependent DNA helicase RecQ